VTLSLARILEDGGIEGAPLDLAAMPGDILPATVDLYRSRGYQPPWIGYLAGEAGRAVGTCAFASPPAEGSVEIAYFTFPGHEGRGVATAMARALIALARAADPSLTLVAYTLPKQSASTRILERLGFQCQGLHDHPEDGWVWAWRCGLFAAPPGE
jgi:RimJ/RimL family protein N-acetyltransferase